MILLQGFRFITGPTTPDVGWPWFVGGLGFIIVLVLIGALVNRVRRPLTPAETARYGRHLFRRTARSVGLTVPQIDTLENLVRATRVRQPLLVFSSSALLDDVLRRGLYSLDADHQVGAEERERRRATIFAIKRVIEQNSPRGVALKTTHFLKPGQQLTVTAAGTPPYPSRVVSNLKDFLAILTPMTANAGRWPRGTQLTIHLWREGDAGYSFTTKVLGYDTVKGSPCAIVQHAKAMSKEQRRRHKRKPLMRNCFTYPVDIIGEGAQRRAAVATNLRTLGTVIDLSVGGCAVQSLSPFEPGRLVMIEFEIERSASIRAFGKVRSVRRTRGRAGLMHVMFTRVTRQYLNRISEFVYDFGRPRTVAESAAQLRPATGVRPPFPTGTGAR